MTTRDHRSRGPITADRAMRDPRSRHVHAHGLLQSIHIQASQSASESRALVSYVSLLRRQSRARPQRVGGPEFSKLSRPDGRGHVPRTEEN